MDDVAHVFGEFFLKKGFVRHPKAIMKALPKLQHVNLCQRSVAALYPFAQLADCLFSHLRIIGGKPLSKLDLNGRARVFGLVQRLLDGITVLQLVHPGYLTLLFAHETSLTLFGTAGLDRHKLFLDTHLVQHPGQGLDPPEAELEVGSRGGVNFLLGLLFFESTNPEKI